MTTHEDQTSTDTSTDSGDGAGTDEKPTIDELQSDIEQTRADLAETVDALTAKLDVKSRTKARLGASKDQALDRLGAAQTKATGLAVSTRNAATDDEGKPTMPVLVGAGVAVATLIALSLLEWRRRR